MRTHCVPPEGLLNQPCMHDLCGSISTQSAVEAARFLWEQERKNGYERPKWSELLERWNAKYPEAAFENYNNFRTVCMRGVRAILKLNLSSPQPNLRSSSEE